MATYLLDASALIDWLQGMPAARRLMETLTNAGHDLAVCCVSVAEVYSGLNEDERLAVEPAVSALHYWNISFEAGAMAGQLRYLYRRRGIQLSTPDALIAALAIVRNAVLVTGNVKDFPMPEIRLEPLNPA